MTKFCPVLGGQTDRIKGVTRQGPPYSTAASGTIATWATLYGWDGSGSVRAPLRLCWGGGYSNSTACDTVTGQQRTALLTVQRTATVTVQRMTTVTVQRMTTVTGQRTAILTMQRMTTVTIQLWL